jgi:lipopolysaccharide transport system ATP-binding protein
MTAVARLCERTILLQEGRVLRDGPTHEVLAVYLDAGSGPGAAKEWPNRATAPGKDVSRLRAVRVRNARGDVVEAIDIREPVTLEMEYDVYEPGHVISPGFTVSNDQELDLFSTADSHPSWQRTRRPAGRYVSRVVIPGNFLAEGRMYVNSGLATMNPVVYQFDESRLVSFEVVDAADGDSVRGDWSGRWAGVVRPMLNWTTEVHPLEDVEQPAVQEPTGVPSGHRG